MKHWFLVLIVGTLLAPVYREKSVEGQTARCPRQAARTFVPGSVTDIADAEPPCRIEFRESGIRLEAVADGSRPDPGRTIVVDSRGRFISANARGWEGVISVWDTRGRYLASFGGEGDETGGFSRRGVLNLMIDGQDNVHIRDGSPSWWVFSPEHRFVRRAPAQAMGGLFGRTVVLDNGWAVASDGVLSEPSYHFRMVDSTGALSGAFGPVGNGASGRAMRLITYAGGSTFWAGPGERDAEAYVLEEWGIDRKLRRTLRRRVPWWQWRGETLTSPTVRRLHITRDGLLYILVRRPTKEYVRQYANRESREEILGEGPATDSNADLVDFVLEVVDTKSGQLLASEVYPQSQVGDILPRDLFRGSLMGYRHGVGDDGLAIVEIMTVELVRSREGK